MVRGPVGFASISWTTQQEQSAAMLGQILILTSWLVTASSQWTDVRKEQPEDCVDPRSFGAVEGDPGASAGPNWQQNTKAFQLAIEAGLSSRKLN